MQDRRAKSEKIRLDQLLVQRGLVENPSKARARIMAGDVIVNDHRVDKPGEKFHDDVDVRLRNNSQPFVSRGGLKLEHALITWPYDIAGAIAIDVGASTGGFTEVLLKNGVKTVYAVDVGYGQLAESLRTDPRVINMERTHILKLSADALPIRPQVAVIDVSFISLASILPQVVNLLADRAIIYALIKPQFEAGRDKIEKGGLVTDPQVHDEVIQKITAKIIALGLTVLGIDTSPIQGGKGNTEFLIAAALDRHSS